MLDWLKPRRLLPDRTQSTKTVHRVVAGKYVLLYDYLANRYADSVVLTFAQIEDLLGFPLPPQARLQRDWWLAKDASVPGAAHAEAWILASRTAVPDLMAKTVMFDRVS
jgi:hypothetical protein